MDCAALRAVSMHTRFLELSFTSGRRMLNRFVVDKMAVLRNGGEWKDFRLPLRLLIFIVGFPKCVLSFLFGVNS